MSVESPCIGVCALNPEDICDGCYRTAEEITYWSNYGDEEKREILKKSQQRFKADQKIVLS